MTGWIKVHRSMLKWEWYDDHNTSRLFLHLILRANFEDRPWRGVMVKRGQMCTGFRALAKETGLTVRSVRTSLCKLKSTGEVTIKTTHKYSLITVVRFDSYQALDKENDTQKAHRTTQQRHSSDTVATRSKKERNKEGNIIPPKKETKTHDRKGNPKRLVKGSENILMSEEQIAAFKKHYATEGMTKEEVLEALAILDAWAINNAKKFEKYTSHYLALLGWVKKQVLKNRIDNLRLEREEMYHAEAYVKANKITLLDS